MAAIINPVGVVAGGLMGSSVNRTNIADDEIYLSGEQISKLADRAETSRELLGGLILSLIKWIIASLLIINAGGAIAVLNIKTLRSVEFLTAGSAFVVGLIFALLCAFICLYEILKFLPDQGELMVLQPGVHKKEKIERITSGREAKEAL